MRSALKVSLSAIALAVTACTTFQEEDVPDKLSVNALELSFLKAGESQQVKVSSGAKWDVPNKPSWINIDSISQSVYSPFEWMVNFSAQENNEYDREGMIVFKAGSDSAEISVTQEGGKGKYIAVETVSLSPTELSLTEGENVNLSYQIEPSNASIQEVKWGSSDPSVATVTPSGQVDALSEGITQITITTEDGSKTASCMVSVNAKVIPVTSVSLDKTSLNLTEGEVYELSATVTPSDASNNSVTWSSSDTSVATVSSTGLVTAKAAGTATINVTTDDGGKKATCTVTVQAKVIAVTGVNLDKTSLSITVGETQALTATVTPSNATDKSVTWSSSNTSVATVSSSGVVTAKAVGSTTITVKTNDGGKTVTCSVNVQAKTVPVTGISLDSSSISLSVGSTHTLSATVVPSDATDKTITWSSSNTSVATVSSSGVVTAMLVGSATITATTNDGNKTATCSVTVTYPAPVAIDLGLSVKWASSNIGAVKPEDTGYYYPWGETEPAAFSYGDSFFYTWDSYKWYNSSDKTLTKYCSIANYGHNGYSDSRTILDQNDDAAYFNLGSTWRTPTNEEFAQLIKNCTWKWTSTNGVKGYLVTGPNGNSIFLPAAGFGTMMDFSNGGTQGYYWSSSLRTDYPFSAYSFSFGTSSYDSESRNRYCILPIRPVTGAPFVSVTGISLNKTSLSLTVGDSQTLMATISPSNATDKSVTWSSSNTSVATVSSSGMVTAKAAGSATITVTTNDGGKKATCPVTVNAQTVAVTGVSLNKTSLSMTVGNSQTLTASVTPSNATDKSVTWSSNSTSIASVSSSGIVTAKAPGSATISVKTNDGGKTATCSVVVEATLPTFSQVRVYNIQPSSATLSTPFPSLGDGEILEKGFCYGTSPNPDKDDNIVYAKDVYESEYWVESLTGLTPNTKYYVRAFATTQYGTSYSEQVSFTTTVALTGLVFIPQEYIEGVGSVLLVNNFSFTPKTLDKANSSSEKQIKMAGAKEVNLSQTVTAQYHVTPANSDLSFLMEGESTGLSFIKQKAVSSDLDVTPVFKSFENGILTVEIQVTGISRTENLQSLIALNVQRKDGVSIISDYTPLMKEDFYLGIAFKNSYAKSMLMVSDAHFRRASVGISGVDAKAYIKDQAAWTTTSWSWEDSGASSDISVIYNRSIDLNSLVAVHKVTEDNEDDPDAKPVELTSDDLSYFGLTWDFTIVNNYKIEQNGSSTDQGGFVSLSGGVLTPQTNSSGETSIGRTPIIRIALKYGGYVVEYAYLKVLIADAEPGT